MYKKRVSTEKCGISKYPLSIGKVVVIHYEMDELWSASIFIS